MNRLAKILALAAVTLGGAFLTTAAQASAANFSVSFAIHNNDSTYNMIRQTDPLPSGVTGLIKPPTAISPGNNDPATSFATFSGMLPALNHPEQTSLVYSKDTDSTDFCTFTIKVSNVGGSLPYVLHITSDQSRCTVPADQNSANGQFTSSTSVLAWKS
jgi:hypothetical protein